MKHSQNNTQAQVALLRNDSEIDSPVKNSLCCIAAGITALSSTTTEVLTPHKKLRGTAPSDATLIAQERLLAQPVVGYAHASGHVEYLPEGGESRRYSLVVPTDTQLIEWLDQRGYFWSEYETSQISFPHEETDTEGYKHVRDALVEAYQQDQAQLSGGDL